MTTIDPWKVYREQEAKKLEFDLSEIGLPNFRIRVLNTSIYSLAELREMSVSAGKKNVERLTVIVSKYNALKDELQTRVDAGSVTVAEMSTELSALEFQEPMTIPPGDRDLILWWNLTDSQTGELLALPKDDPQVLFRIPTAVQEYILDRIYKAISEANDVPKVTVTSSEPA